MKQSLTTRTNFLISLIIVLGFALVSLINYATYSAVIKDDIENISELTSTNIYASINSELTKPIFVSLTMANDSFLKTWLKQESTVSDEDLHLEELKKYLLGIKDKYQYDSVFLVSDATKRYYHFQGINKIVTPQDEHDIWYYAFTEADLVYDLDVDNDEVSDDALTVFVNCRIEDEDGTLMGVVGVGLKMDLIQALLHHFETEFNLTAFLVSREGIVQVHTDSGQIETVNVFDNQSIAALKESILNNKTLMQTFPYTEEDVDGYIITRYISDLDWYLVVEKDVSALNKALKAQLERDFIVAGFVLGFLLLLSTRLIKRYQRKVAQIAKVDDLTQLPNRRAFDMSVQDALKQYNKNNQSFCVFIFDIDEFKRINDHFGHMRGDQVLIQIGRLAKEHLGEAALIARWGGDEFAGILPESLSNAQKQLEEFAQSLSKLTDISEMDITISVGVSAVRIFDTPDTLITRADDALYKAKAAGKNKVSIIE